MAPGISGGSWIVTTWESSFCAWSTRRSSDRRPPAGVGTSSPAFWQGLPNQATSPRSATKLWTPTAAARNSESRTLCIRGRRAGRAASRWMSIRSTSRPSGYAGREAAVTINPGRFRPELVTTVTGSSAVAGRTLGTADQLGDGLVDVDLAARRLLPCVDAAPNSVEDRSAMRTSREKSLSKGAKKVVGVVVADPPVALPERTDFVGDRVDDTVVQRDRTRKDRLVGRLGPPVEWNGVPLEEVTRVKLAGLIPAKGCPERLPLNHLKQNEQRVALGGQAMEYEKQPPFKNVLGESNLKGAEAVPRVARQRKPPTSLGAWFF